MACDGPSCNFRGVQLARRNIGKNDIEIAMKYCGVCHSDLSIAAGHLEGFAGKVEYKCVPGHELAGVCTRVGEAVTKVKVGDHVGVGCMVDSCGKCKSCRSGNENKCMYQVQTYQGKDLNGRAAVWPPKSRTLGGYTDVMVVHENFAINIPKHFPLEAAGPVMCAGVTMYDPMLQHGVKAGDKVGIVGLGGLGSLGTKIARALGCEVSVISRSHGKDDLAFAAGASNVIASTSEEDMAKHAGSLDIIINTVPVYHDYNAYMPLLNRASRIGKQVLLGLHEGIGAGFILNAVTFGCSRITSSGIGGIPATQAVIDLCAKHDIRPDLEIVGASKLNSVYQQLDDSNDSGKRFVIDISTIKEGLVCDDPAPRLKDYKGMTIRSIVGEFAKNFVTLRWR